MSWQKRSIQLIFGFPFCLPIIAYAVNIGDTYVQSQQNQPLNASINVSDIDPATFSVKIANPDIYRQLGLSKESDIKVRFQPTSSDGGQILLTTKKPVNAPFTDVVLNIANKGEVKTLPKTLLMPLDNSQKITTQPNSTALQSTKSKVVIGANNPVNLPVVNDNTVNTTSSIVATLPNISTSNQASVPPTVTQPQGTTNNGNLTIQEVRSYRLPGQQPIADISSQAPTSPVTTNVANEPTPNKAINKPQARRSHVTADNGNSPAPTDTVTYVLQRNDNLWTIASRLAKQNKKDVNTVMQDIMAANPTAFVDNDPTKLVAHTELALPKYQVVPSQTGIKAANKARQTYRTKHAQRITKTKLKKAETVKSTSTLAKASHKTVNKRKVTSRVQSVPSVTKAPVAPKTTRKPEMTIIAPSQSNGSVQGQTSANKNPSGKGLSPQVIAQVQQKRQATATQASKVGKLNQNLVSAETRLKLQNAKLAQLEQRLKELNKK